MPELNTPSCDTKVSKNKPATLIEALWAKAQRAWARTKYIAEDWNLRIVHGSTKAQEDEYQKAIANIRAMGDGTEQRKRLRASSVQLGEMAKRLRELKKLG